MVATPYLCKNDDRQKILKMTECRGNTANDLTFHMFFFVWISLIALVDQTFRSRQEIANVLTTHQQFLCGHLPQWWLRMLRKNSNQTGILIQVSWACHLQQKSSNKCQWHSKDHCVEVLIRQKEIWKQVQQQRKSTHYYGVEYFDVAGRRFQIAGYITKIPYAIELSETDKAILQNYHFIWSRIHDTRQVRHQIIHINTIKAKWCLSTDLYLCYLFWFWMITL